MAACALVLASVLGCASRSGALDGSGGTEDGVTDDGAGTGTSSTSTGGSDDPSTGGSSTDGESEASADDGTAFVNVDAGCSVVRGERCSCGVMCDIWKPDDCPEGEKCTAVACEPGSTAWDSNVCRRIQGDDQFGEPCTGAGVDGNDSCVEGSMCFDADPDTGLGWCMPFCGGDPAPGECPAGYLCTQFGSGVIPWCFPRCDPLAPACLNPNNLCIPHPGGDGFTCMLDASGGMGPYGTPCSFANSCNHGLLCIAAESVPDAACDGAASCCSPVCDLDEPNTCPGAAAGQTCEPFYEAPEIPAGYENVGVCAVAGP